MNFYGSWKYLLGVASNPLFKFEQGKVRYFKPLVQKVRPLDDPGSFLF